MTRLTRGDVLSPMTHDRVVELTRRTAADGASAALRDALSLAGAESIGEREVEALFVLLERIEHQSSILQHRFEQLQGCNRVATRGPEVTDGLRSELVVMRSRLKRLHIAACLAEALAYAGSDGSSGRVRALELRLARFEQSIEADPECRVTTVNRDDSKTRS